MAKDRGTNDQGVVDEDGPVALLDTSKLRGPNGALTLDGMRTIIRRGESVGWRGKTISNEADLPTEIDLAEGDEQATLAAVENLNRQRAAIDAQLARVSSHAKTSGSTTSARAAAARQVAANTGTGGVAGEPGVADFNRRQAAAVGEHAAPTVPQGDVVANAQGAGASTGTDSPARRATRRATKRSRSK